MGSFEELLNNKRFYNKNLILRKYDSISSFLCDFLDYVYERVNNRNYFNDLELSNIERYIDSFICFSEILFYKMKLIYDRSQELFRCCGRKDKFTLKFLIRYFGNIISVNSSNWVYEKKEFEHFIDSLLFDKNDPSVFSIIIESSNIFKFRYSDGEFLINKVIRYFKNSLGDFDKFDYYSKVILELVKKDTGKVDYVVSCLNDFNKSITDKGINSSVSILIDRVSLLGVTSISKDKKNTYIKQFKNNFGIYDAPCTLKADSLIQTRVNQVEDLRDRKIITIDSSFSCAYDDAISIEKTDYGYLFSIYISDVASFVDMKSLLYKFAKDRCESIYGDNFYMPMFPLDVTNLFSLSKENDRYVIAYDFKFSDDFDFIGTEYHNALIRVNENYSFDGIDNIDMNDSNYNMIYSLIKITDSLRKQFIGDFVSDGVGSSIISTSSLYLNSSIADLFSLLKFPFIYKDSIKYSSVPISHPCVDKPYGQITNPIRSYVSFLNQYFFECLMLDSRPLCDVKDFVKNWHGELPSIVDYINRRLALNKDFVCILDELDRKRLTKK